jgi:hypothetical protein
MLYKGNFVMNKVMKIGVTLATSAAIAFVAGCTVPPYHCGCGQIDYKSRASCKGYGVKKTSCCAATCKGMSCKAHVHVDK